MFGRELLLYHPKGGGKLYYLTVGSASSIVGYSRIYGVSTGDISPTDRLNVLGKEITILRIARVTSNNPNETAVNITECPGGATFNMTRLDTGKTCQVDVILTKDGTTSGSSKSLLFQAEDTGKTIPLLIKTEPFNSEN